MNPTTSLRERMNAQPKKREAFEQAKTHAFEYLEAVGDGPVFPKEAALAGLEAFDEPLPDAPCDPAVMLRQLHEVGSPATVASTGGRYFGFVTGSAFPPVMAAKWLADVWDQNAALNVMSPVCAKLESVCERWLVDLLALPLGCVAGFVGGTSTATAVGIASARHELLRRCGWDVNAQGLFGAPPIRVVVGDEAHSTVFKALAFLGLGRDRVERVPVDGHGRMIAEAMPALDERTLVLAQAGNVNTGSFDPFEAICERAEEAHAWVHVDGAIGLWAAASPRLRPLVQGVARADSWSVDAHKALNAPYDCGIVLCRHPESIMAAMQNTGAYIIYSGARDGMIYTPEMSRRGRGIDLWATLKTLGREGVIELIEGLCDRAAQASGSLNSAGFRILNEVVFNQVLVACDTKEQTLATLEGLQSGGECWCGGTTWQGQAAIRFSVCSWATSEEDIERAVAAFIRARGERGAV